MSDLPVPSSTPTSSSWTSVSSSSKQKEVCKGIETSFNHDFPAFFKKAAHSESNRSQLLLQSLMSSTNGLSYVSICNTWG